MLRIFLCLLTAFTVAACNESGSGGDDGNDNTAEENGNGKGSRKKRRGLRCAKRLKVCVGDTVKVANLTTSEINEETIKEIVPRGQLS
ncbi:MAG: hypothetical protein AAF202_09175, partial [Pseudomonadota bacterium]